MASSTEPIESRWFRALYEENCKQVMELLKDRPELLKLGWEADSKRLVGGRDRYRRPDPSLLPVLSSRPPIPWKGRTALHVGARRGCAELVQQIVDMVVDDKVLPPRAATVGQVSLCLGTLLSAKDGEYMLDALAMALVIANRAIMVTLMQASHDCPSNPYEIPHGWLPPNTPSPPSLDHDNLLRSLQESTKAILDAFPGTSLQDAYDKNGDYNFLPPTKYLFHFTFCIDILAVDGYLPGDDKNEVGRQILEKCSSEVKDFLFGLRDEQGRTPGHVAVDEDTKMFERFGRLISATPENTGQKMRWLDKRDACGRAPLHRAASTGRLDGIMSYNKWAPKGEGIDFSVTFRVFPVIKVTPLGQASPLKSYEKKIDGVDIEFNKVAKRNGYKGHWVHGASMGLHIDFNKVTRRNGFKGNWVDGEYTALHCAIIHKQVRVVEVLLPFWEAISGRLPNGGRNLVQAERVLQLPFVYNVPKQTQEPTYQQELTPLQLAAIVGNADVMEKMLERQQILDMREQTLSAMHFYHVKGWISAFYARFWDYWKPLSTSKGSSNIQNQFPAFRLPSFQFPAFHIAAASGNLQLIKIFVDRNNFDTQEEDGDGNSALHVSIRGMEIEFNMHLLDYVSCSHIAEAHVQDLEWRTTSGGIRQETLGNEEDNERQGCIDLLLQAGFDIWKTNKHDKIPYPGSHVSPKFLSWWYQTLSKEIQAAQATLKAASNTISVTAALVATASYVGPLQPPLGYNIDGAPGLRNHVHVESLLVRMFMVCDTLSFYLAVAALMLSMIPSLPMPEESRISMEGLRQSRRIVAIALSFLFPSIVFVLLAFAASSIIAIPNNSSWNHGGLTIIPISIGGFICAYVIVLFIVKLTRFVFHKNIMIRNINKALF